MDLISETSRIKLEVLLDKLGRVDSAVIAFSGGVDSSLLVYLASRVMKDVLAVVAASPTQSEGELECAKAFAEVHSFPLRVIEYNELGNPEFVANDPERCYHCKLELFGRLRDIAEAEGLANVVDGSNYDDLNDCRPGSRAAAELGVRQPLQEVGVTKEEIRALSRELGLGNWSKPSLACLASRSWHVTPTSLTATSGTSSAKTRTLAGLVSIWPKQWREARRIR